MSKNVMVMSPSPHFPCSSVVTVLVLVVLCFNMNVCLLHTLPRSLSTRHMQLHNCNQRRPPTPKTCKPAASLASHEQSTGLIEKCGQVTLHCTHQLCDIRANGRILVAKALDLHSDVHQISPTEAILLQR